MEGGNSNKITVESVLCRRSKWFYKKGFSFGIAIFPLQKKASHDRWEGGGAAPILPLTNLWDLIFT